MPKYGVGDAVVVDPRYHGEYPELKGKAFTVTRLIEDHWPRWVDEFGAQHNYNDAWQLVEGPW